MITALQNDIRQFYSYDVLKRFDRLADAEVQFTFDEADIYISIFSESMAYLDTSGFVEYDPALAEYARVFERYAVTKAPSVNQVSAGIMSAALYWLSGYSANAFLIASVIYANGESQSDTHRWLLSFLSKKIILESDKEKHGKLQKELNQYLSTGQEERLERAKDAARVLASKAYSHNFVEEYIAAILLEKVLERLRLISIWASIKGRSSASNEAWQRYMKTQLHMAKPIIDLWPSQRKAIEKGLLDGHSSLVLRMPTSAGKTKMTELAFVNDLLTDSSRRCLYLAPFRALVSEVEKELGDVFSKLNIPIASLYGSSDANAIEVELANVARVIVATPEKIKAVLTLSGKKLSDFGTIVLDEGHLIDSISRGAAYELQLANLRSELSENGRTILLSAVLPNSEDLAAWLGGSAETLAEDIWQPTSMRIGVVVWPQNKNARLTYVASTGQQLTDKFFVPRIIEEDVWKEYNSTTNRTRTHSFPHRGNNGTIAAALSFKYVKDGPVIIYASRPDWAESIAGRIIDRIKLQRPIATNLIDDENRAELISIAEYLSNVLGEYSDLPIAVEHGFAFHHGQLPQGVRLVIEEEYKKQTIRLLIATNTLAQGVNLPAKAVIVHSLPHSDAPIRDFWNLVGRAGRALKESEGEVIIIASQNLNFNRLRSFLDRDKIEPIQSSILRLVSALIRDHGVVDDKTIKSFLSNDESLAVFQQTINSLDLHLLELIAEEEAAANSLELAEKLAKNLFAYYQAEKIDLETGSSIKVGVEELIQQRSRSVLLRVPEAEMRRRFAVSGISLNSNESCQKSISKILELLSQNEQLTDEAFKVIVDIISKFDELNGVEASLIRKIGFEWISMSNYSEIYKNNKEHFTNFGEVVRFVEDVICYRMPWAINGIVRLAESELEGIDDIAIKELPEWFDYLPQFFRYGVSEKELVWVMSLGIQDRNVAHWLLQSYKTKVKRLPKSLKQFLVWSLDNRKEILSEMGAVWPKYFVRLFNNILIRYDKIAKLISG